MRKEPSNDNSIFNIDDFFEFIDVTKTDAEQEVAGEPSGTSARGRAKSRARARSKVGAGTRARAKAGANDGASERSNARANSKAGTNASDGSSVKSRARSKSRASSSDGAGASDGSSAKANARAKSKAECSAKSKASVHDTDEAKPKSGARVTEGAGTKTSTRDTDEAKSKASASAAAGVGTKSGAATRSRSTVGAGTSARTNSKAGAAAGTRSKAGAGTNAGANPKSRARAATGTNSKAGAKSTAGIESNTRAKSSASDGTRTRAKVRSNSKAGAGAGGSNPNNQVLRKGLDAATELAGKTYTGTKSIFSRYRYLVGIIAMILFLLVCAYYLVFMPRDAATLFKFGTSTLEGVDCYHAELLITETRHMSGKDITALKHKKEKFADIPVHWVKNIDKSGDIRYITCTANYTYSDSKGSITKEAFSDGEENYVLEKDVFVPARGRSKEDSFLLAEINLERLLHLSDTTLSEAAFGSEWTVYKVGVAGEEATGMLRELLGLTPEKYRIENGVVVYCFDKFSKKLKDIKVKGLELYDAKAPDDAVPTSTMDLVLTVDGINSVKPKDVVLPDENDDGVEIVTDADAKELKKPKKVQFSANSDDEKRLAYYVVGEDINPGTYKLTCKKGMGIVMGIKGEDGAKKFRYCAGYEYYKYDNLGKGKEVKLNDGDRILVAGKKFKIEFSPKKSAKRAK